MPASWNQRTISSPPRIAREQHPLAAAGYHEHDRGEVEHVPVQKGSELERRLRRPALAPFPAQLGDLLGVRSDHPDRQAAGELRRISGLDDAAAEGAVYPESDRSSGVRKFAAAFDRAQNRRDGRRYLVREDGEILVREIRGDELLPGIVPEPLAAKTCVAPLFAVPAQLAEQLENTDDVVGVGVQTATTSPRCASAGTSARPTNAVAPRTAVLTAVRRRPERAS